MKSISKSEFYAILATVINEALPDAAPHLTRDERHARAAALAARTAQRLYEPKVEASNG